MSNEPGGRPMRATYRVQLTPEFTFADAAGIAGYLGELGVSHLYCSPYLQAGPGSAHGYDVVDHTRLSAELGGAEGHARMVAALHGAQMGHILDIVPNHMAIGGREGVWWWDVLKNGPDSAYARFFDIDWEPSERRLRGKILVPILGDQYGRILENGELGLDRDGDEIIVRYQNQLVPVAPGSIQQLPGAWEDEDDAIDHINSEPALLHALLESQHYRLAFWRTDLELNYRRFFDINNLVALRMEEAPVFDHVHKLALALHARGDLDGLRIDHVDGLRDPAGYLEQLRAGAPHAYLVVEKILGPDEELPSEWPVEGTTGYDFLNLVSGLFVDPDGEKPLTDLYVTFSGEIAGLDELVHERKIRIMQEVLTSDVERLVTRLVNVCERHPRHRDYTRNELRVALREIIAALDVYRTYIQPDVGIVTASDARRVEAAVAAAREHRPDIEPDLLNFIRDVLLLHHDGVPEADFTLRWQQTTGPIMAKAVEDTVFYNYNRLVSLNEVGGHPGVFGVSPSEFHATNARVGARWPNTMLAGSTHDTKRSEDVRARINLLSEIPDTWARAVRRWSGIAERYRTGDLPDRNAEYLLYQTLVGAHPLPVSRAIEFMIKAAREAKRYTSWTDPDPAYEQALLAFVEEALADRGFTSELEAFVAPLVEPGWINSLAQTLLRFTSPGVPDVYQGCELWNYSLVDPDNRRPVDYASRRVLLDWIAGRGPHEIWERAAEGAPKLYVIKTALDLRRRFPEAFGSHSAYSPIAVEAPATGADEHLVAFARGDSVIVVVPRLVLGRPPGWGSALVPLPGGSWSNRFGAGGYTQGVAAEDLFADFPVALLVREEPG